jgi:phenylalanyl-tRNA synthetase beta chain
LCAASATRGATAYRDVVSFPPVREDLAVVVDDGVSARTVVAAIQRVAGPLLEHCEIFDVYRGEQVGSGRHSLALRLVFRAPDRTLTSEDVAGRRAAIEQALDEIGGQLRG